MDWFWWVIYVVTSLLCYLAGLFIGWKDAKKNMPHIGTLIIDKFDGGLYTVFDKDPKTMKKGDLVAVDILFADLGKLKSQQNQGA